MLDMTICVGGDCPLKQDCRRWEVNSPCSPDCLGQSFFIKPPFVGKSCEYYEHIFKRIEEKGDAK
jgi:hypothetical protein